MVLGEVNGAVCGCSNERLCGGVLVMVTVVVVSVVGLVVSEVGGWVVGNRWWEKNENVRWCCL